MVRRVKFERGDIVRVSLNPTVGKEQQGDFRPALVLSPAAFNALGVALVAPITQGGEFARYAGFAVPLSGSGTETQGVALVNMVRTLDLEARGARKVERAPSEVVEDALARLQTILE
ncbi:MULTISPECIES: type II toxin-antitoxin system ChpB family toxin [Burkholderia]|uniref:Type II toxin-antitoxin system ChpB family toxin n=1 Tax=Burkholderia contaminans TaxID=488447 RepID=A0A2S5DNJ2_9BURK|nr:MULTISPECIES: type II toxin-antitoxin system ChpB family toxin [Burkholderia]EKS9797610.1 type II toxin-antitoxin system ChpB family toxin [Burkholderia cepacia]EKS9805320.1 type II toxin-antitoxin system ChpB family toxin [Burkholderia cepacia]EKS9813228.1 type II toxin-antitoxin system ChpB family toxin [Burkholderia cepacia]EKS9818564.1 type II toxin-antitoxin system ChpB family toxin [Burkholderia cepacia]EKS9826303.1 type II toxin-antitoxin system ChpB family toxin [Burkholderia cepaci